MKTLRVFGASWCVNCKQLTKQLDQRRVEYEYVDIDVEPTMAKAYEIRSLPTSVIADEDSYTVVVGNNLTDVLRALE